MLEASMNKDCLLASERLLLVSRSKSGTPLMKAE